MSYEANSAPDRDTRTREDRLQDERDALRRESEVLTDRVEKAEAERDALLEQRSAYPTMLRDQRESLTKTNDQLSAEVERLRAELAKAHALLDGAFV